MTPAGPPLLDTTYLLPFFGIRIRPRGPRESVPQLVASGRSLLYHPLSLVEAKWVVLALERRGLSGVRTRFLAGLDALLMDKRWAAAPLTSHAIEADADSLLDEGLADYFDRMLAATAHCVPATLLTEDEELLNPQGPLAVLPGLRVTTAQAFLTELQGGTKDAA